MDDELSPLIISKFSKFVRRTINDFQPDEDLIIERDFEPRECQLYFLTKNFYFNYEIDYKNGCFFLNVNFEIDDDKQPGLRQKFYENMNFLMTDQRFFLIQKIRLYYELNWIKN